MSRKFSNQDSSPSERACTVKGCVWTYRDYGIKKNGGKSWYVWYYDAATQETQRHSLFTSDLNVAQEKVINMANGIDPKHLGGDPIIYDIMTEFVNTFPSKRPAIAPNPDGTPLKPWQRSKRTQVDHSHRTWKMMEPTFASLTKNKRISQLHPEFQEDILKHLSDRGYAVTTLSLMMSFFSRGLTWASTPDRHGVIKSRHRPEIIRKQKTIARIVDRPRPKPDNYAPRRDEMVKVILALSNNEPVRRWLILMLTFGCRVEAAAEATSEQLDGEIFHLNPEGRPEDENKRRPDLPVAWSSLTELRTWGEGEWVGMSANSIGYAIRKVRNDIGLPKLKASSIRDYIATMLRHAHVHYGARKIDKEERRKWQGHAHEVDKTNDGYGEVLPEFYLRAKIATEAMLRDLDFRSGGALFRQGPDKTPLREYASLEDFEKFGLLGANPATELPQETCVFIGPNREKTGNSEPLEGSFRQISDNKVRHADGTIDAIGCFQRRSFEQRLTEQGVMLLEPILSPNRVSEADIYLVSGGLNVVPAARAGSLKSALNDTLPHIEAISPGGWAAKYISDRMKPLYHRLREFEFRMTLEYDSCNDTDHRADIDAIFYSNLKSIVYPIINNWEDDYVVDFDLDTSGWTDKQFEDYENEQIALRHAKIVSGEIKITFFGEGTLFLLRKTAKLRGHNDDLKVVPSALIVEILSCRNMERAIIIYPLQSPFYRCVSKIMRAVRRRIPHGS